MAVFGNVSHKPQREPCAVDEMDVTDSTITLYVSKLFPSLANTCCFVQQCTKTIIYPSLMEKYPTDELPCILSSHVVNWSGVVHDSWEGREKVSRASNTTQIGAGAGLLGFTTAVNNPLMNEGVSPSRSIVLLGHKERAWKAHSFTAYRSSLC